jgi:RND family efflux transporter MFP subunit
MKKRTHGRWLTLLMLAPLATPGLAQDKSVHVTTRSIDALQFHPEHSAPATVISLNDSGIGAHTSGVLTGIPVRVGDRVEKGALLAELDCRQNSIRLRQAEAALESIEARVTLARRQIKRTESLRKERNVSEELLNQREADLLTSRADRQAQFAAVESARLEVSRCRITAPFGGVVTERLAGEGEWINPGQPVVRIVDNQRLEVSARIPLDQADTFDSDTSFTLDSSIGRFGLKLRRQLPVIESRGRNREIRLIFDAEPALAGTTGRLAWRSSQPYLPADLPVRRGERLGLFLLEGDKARFHPLPEALEGQPASIALPGGTAIIIEGRQALEDGSPVKTGP